MSGFITITQKIMPMTNKARVKFTRKIISIVAVDEVEELPEGLCLIKMKNGNDLEVLESYEYLMKCLNSPKISYIVSSANEVLPPEDNFTSMEKGLPNWISGDTRSCIANYSEFRYVMRISKDVTMSWLKMIEPSKTEIIPGEFMIVLTIGIGRTEESKSQVIVLAIERRNDESYHLYQSLRR